MQITAYGLSEKTAAFVFIIFLGLTGSYMPIWFASVFLSMIASFVSFRIKES